MTNSDKQIWFPAKRYGWGWGLPITWQGWVVMGVWLAAYILGALFLARPDRWMGFVAFTILTTSLLVAICWCKGEKPRWRWGD